MLNEAKKHIHVTCAIIERDGSVLAAQRSATMSLPLKWEFPGGKIRNEESPDECLRREIAEELDVEIVACKPLSISTHSYPAITVTLYPFVCTIVAGEIKLHEHAAVTWLPPEKLHQLDWAEADLPVLAAYCQQLLEVKA
ncbi:MAG: (deoxy)nucleoside triphosphate pyrophosphohydrolase [Desulfobulbaceae bacterium]|jgi:8-oxo-dGTP diphosphatase